MVLLKFIIDLKLFKKRENGHKYHLYHQGNKFLVLEDKGGEYLNNRLVSYDIKNYSSAEWTLVVPYDPFIHILDVVAFKDYIVCIRFLTSI